jgi:hypothetical protein
MLNEIGNRRLYQTLCKVLDALRKEAPSTSKPYHPNPSNQEGVIQARSRALLHLFLKARFGITRFDDREKMVTDGPQDGGIDAYYIDRREKLIYVLQSKFRATAGNFVSSNMSSNDLLKMDVSRILHGEKSDENNNLYNEKIRNGLQRAMQKLPDVGSYTGRVLLLGNAKKFTQGDLKKLVSGYVVDQFPHERIYSELLFPVINGTYFTDPNLTIEISLANLKGDTHLDYDVKAQSLRSNVKLLFVPTREMGRIMETYKNSILRFNPRSFLELDNNSVNKQIEQSIRNERANEFALYNNGITMVADQTSISSDTAKQGTAQVVLRNPQLVNGGQTAYTLGRIYEQCRETNNYKVFKGKEVLLRIITFVGAKGAISSPAKFKLIADISKASNSQTKVEESDRRSNDEIQIRLQSEFFDRYGLYYERKKGEFADGIKSSYLDQRYIVNREKLVRVSLATDYRVNQARSSIQRFFKESALDSVLKAKDVEKYAYAYEVLRLLEEKKAMKPTTKKDRYHTTQYGQALRYGQYAVVAVCANRGITAKKSELKVTDAVLSQWIDFEKYATTQSENEGYYSGTSFDYVNYYKGSTVNNDLQNQAFVI